MAQIDDSGGGGGRRSVSVDVNIVPVIDLMSVLIIFMLITAVWSQVSMIQIGSSMYAKNNDPTQQQDPPPPLIEVPLRVDVKGDGYRVLVGKQLQSIPKMTDGTYDQAQLITQLKKIKELYADKNDAVLAVDEELAYDFLIGGMDALLTAGFPQISIATQGAE